MNRFAAVLGALALASLGASTAGAQVATGTLTFLQPDGVVGANDIVPINVRLTLNSDSTTLAVDVDGRVTSGGPSDDEFLARNFDPSIPFQMRFLPSASCSGTFFPPNSCAAGNYCLNSSNRILQISHSWPGRFLISR